MSARVLILHASGTNRDADAAFACRLAGGLPEIVPLSVLREDRRRFGGYQALLVPGGFSYGDALGAGRLLALDLRAYFADEVRAFVDAGKPVLGICNGFQALVKAGLLPGNGVQASLTNNFSGRFECRWVTLAPAPGGCCIWTRGLMETLHCPVAHGEGAFVLQDLAALPALRDAGQIALTYSSANGEPALGRYPANPNGSIADIAGVCNAAGTVLGLMPHPEDAVLETQLPRWSRDDRRGLGLALFENGMRYAAQL